MLGRKRLIAGCLMTLVAVWGASGQGRAGAAAQDPGQFIESLADRAISALAVKDITREERSRRFRALLKEHFAVETIGRWVLGRHWRQATEEERAEYMALFEDLLVVTYVNRFEAYSGETLEVRRTVVNPGQDSVVYSQIIHPNGDPPLEVAWRVRTRDGKHKIVDVIVAGISMGQAQRSEFGSVIRKNGGAMDGFLAELRQRVKGDV